MKKKEFAEASHGFSVREQEIIAAALRMVANDYDSYMSSIRCDDEPLTEWIEEGIHATWDEMLEEISESIEPNDALIVSLESIRMMKNIICERCGGSDDCLIHDLFDNDDDRQKYLIYNGCVCGSFFDDGRHSCRACPSIRNGDCDGPEGHCSDTKCPHRKKKKCPVAYTECKYLYTKE